MANVRISALPSATAVDGADLLPVSQGSTSPDTGTTRKATAAQVVAVLQTAASLAAAGTTQSAATAITTYYVDAFAEAGATGVRLPVAVPGRKYVISCAAGSAAILQIYPAEGEILYIYTVGDQGANMPYPCEEYECFVFECTVAERWYGYQIS